MLQLTEQEKDILEDLIGDELMFGEVDYTFDCHLQNIVNVLNSPDISFEVDELDSLLILLNEEMDYIESESMSMKLTKRYKIEHLKILKGIYDKLSNLQSIERYEK